MEKNVGNADLSHHQNLTDEEVSFAASKSENDVNEGELYWGKIEKRAIKKKNNVYEKGGSKRLRMSMNKVDNKKKVKMVVESHEAIERLKEFITSDKINGSNMKLVIQRTLTATDLKRHHNRLNMPFNQVVFHKFLTQEEMQVLGIGGRRKDGTKPEENIVIGVSGQRKNGIIAIEVQIVGPNLQMYEKPLWLKIWRMSNNDNYVLTKNWCDFVKANDSVLKENATIQVWSFRTDGKLCFGVACVDEPG